MTNTYNVHIYREMRLTYGGIKAESQEAAASIAREKLTSDADSIDDCDGETIAALVDVQGDEEYEQSRMINFEAERLRKAAARSLAALEAVAELRRKWRSQDEAETIDSIEYMNGLDSLEVDTVIAEAKSTVIPSVPPVIVEDAATGQTPARFEIEHNPAENSDRVYVMVDGKFDVAIIRTDEGVVVDVYPKDEFETIATTYAFDSDLEQESSTN
jgi:hypothetical protein